MAERDTRHDDAELDADAGLDDAADAELDAALSWEGDDDLGRTTSLTDPRSAAATRRPRSLSADGAGGAGDDAHLDDADLEADLAVVADRPRRDPVRLLVTGVFAVIYLALTVGWILVVTESLQAGLSVGQSGWVDAIAKLSQFLAFIASALWFVAVVHLTRDSRLLVRVGWFALGTPLLMPWPYVMGFTL
ncbi:hypothetical protein [Schumannella sp. 10F1B-5-1]|uniref:hypothetical protein n=1 Tax=Schumannella sp. 10F1B-5-1 TaxID=2590780 RepID=UPI0011319AA2|nr:hypothetical protein [Schumannella sp. 10F1B-5-1]TPW73628.1 hypothetical protein FJ658_05455 [Schumannella sp. 10F1B-5-1]